MHGIRNLNISSIYLYGVLDQVRRNLAKALSLSIVGRNDIFQRQQHLLSASQRK